MIKKNLNKLRRPELRIVSWGKHAGEKFGGVPSEYLMWFVANSYKQMRDRRKWAKEELARRRIYLL